MNFLEERQRMLPVEDGGVALVLAPKQIQTIEYRVERVSHQWTGDTFRLLVRTSYQLVFSFDGSDRLQKYETKELYTGL